jgi:hypothetical protein
MMLTGATEAEAVAAVQSGAATNLSWSAKLRLAAANLYASVATKAHTVATSISAAATSAHTTVTNLSIMAGSRLAASAIYASVATKAHATATYLGIAATGASATIANYASMAKLRLAAANIYASAATKAHTVATVANSAISWASAGAMAALATIYGVLTGSISLTTVATWGLNTAMTILNALNPFTYIIAGAAILAGIIGIVAYKSGFLGTIWKDLTKIKFGKIFDDLMKGDFSGAWKKLSKGLGTVWDDLKIGASLLPEEVSESITGYLRELVRWVTTSFPFLSKIFELFGKVYSIFEWIYSILSGFWSWIKTTMNALISAFPGGKKAQAKDEWEAAMEKAGVTYDKETGKYYKSGTDETTALNYAMEKWNALHAGQGEDAYKSGPVVTIPWGDAEFQKILAAEIGKEEVTPSQKILDLQAKYEGEKDFMGALRDLVPGAAKENKRQEIENLAKAEGLAFNAVTGQFSDILTKNVRTPSDPKTLQAFDEWKRLPDFAQSIADAVSKAISGIKIEGIQTLVDRLQSLTDALNNFEIPGVGKIGDIGSVVTPESKVYWPIDGGEPITVAEWEKLSPGERTSGEYKYDSSGKNPFERFDAGGIVHTKGFGILDPGDEIISPATATRGPGPIERALDALYGVTARSGVPSTALDSRPVEIHVHTSNDFSGMKVSSAVDVDRLMREIDRRIETGSLAAVQKAIGQRRT